MKKCEICGTENPNKAIFCLNCGERNSFSLSFRKERTDINGIPLRLIKEANEKVSQEIRKCDLFCSRDNFSRVWKKDSEASSLVSVHTLDFKFNDYSLKDKSKEKLFLKWMRSIKKREQIKIRLRLDCGENSIVSILLSIENYLFEIGHFWISANTSLSLKLLPFLQKEEREELLNKNIEDLQYYEKDLSSTTHKIKEIKKINNKIKLMNSKEE